MEPGAAARLRGGGHTCPDRCAGGSHECRYWWSLNDPPYDAWGDTVGYCIDYTQYTVGAGCSYPAMSYPSCKALSPTAHNFDELATDAQAFGCLPHP